jgi:hypothetical protein
MAFLYQGVQGRKRGDAFVTLFGGGNCILDKPTKVGGMSRLLSRGATFGRYEIES